MCVCVAPNLLALFADKPNDNNSNNNSKKNTQIAQERSSKLRVMRTHTHPELYINWSKGERVPMLPMLPMRCYGCDYARKTKPNEKKEAKSPSG